MPTRNVVPTEDAARLRGLRDAAHIGFAALDRGEFREFASAEELSAYLRDLSEQVISRASE
jgi:antitoxin ParD1/3/4